MQACTSVYVYMFAHKFNESVRAVCTEEMSHSSSAASGLLYSSGAVPTLYRAHQYHPENTHYIIMTSQIKFCMCFTLGPLIS